MTGQTLRTAPGPAQSDTPASEPGDAKLADSRGVSLDAPLSERVTVGHSINPQQSIESALVNILKEAIFNQGERAPVLPTSPTLPPPGFGRFPPGGVSSIQNHMAALLRGLGQDTGMGAASSNQVRSPANSEVINSAPRPHHSEAQSNSPLSTSRFGPTSQTIELSRSNQKEMVGAPQRSASAETKAEQPNEVKRADPRADVIAPDVSHKNIAQALEAALDKMLKGSATPPEVKLAAPAQQAAAPQSEASTAAPAPQVTDKGTKPPSNQQSTNGGQVIEPAQQTKPHDNSTVVTSTPTASPQLQQDQLLHQHARHAIEQTMEQIQNQRAEQLRLIQQITAAQTEPPQPQRVPTQTPDTTVNLHPRHESTNLAVEKLRESILDKFISIQTQIETAASERQHTKPAIAPENSAIQGRSTLSKEIPIHHDAKPQHELRHGDRASDIQKLARSIFAGGATPLASAAYPSATAIAHADPTAFSLHSLGNILKTLQIFARSSTNTKLITKMDSALERTCLALVTGAAVGVVGAEILVKTVGLGIRELLRVTREGMQEKRDPTDEALEAELVAALDDYLVEGALEPSKRSMVADVSGVLICSQTHEPLADVLVGSRELGSCMTDHAGRFLFSNVKIGTSYGLKFFKPFFALSPDHVSGTCGFDSHHRVEVVLTPLTAET